MVKTVVSQRGIYSDLMRKFRDKGHQVYIVMPCERRERKPTSVSNTDGVHTLSVRTLNVQKTNVIEKGLGQVMLDYLYMRAIKKYFGNVKFDLITYSTPPITFTKVIEWTKKNNTNAVTYLQLKDIFPQNAVDLGMLKTTGLKGIVYKNFRKKEEYLYEISDYIGCMSPANRKYILEHNKSISASKVEICPNSLETTGDAESDEHIAEKIRLKYNLPLDKPIFIYGGNMGKPQGISFVLECLSANKDREDCHFVLVGNGTEFPKIKAWINQEKPKNITLYKRLPKTDYDNLTKACDVGLIFLDYRFTIPNYPSRLLPYLMSKKPIIAATDPNCDTGLIAEKNKYGFYCPSNNVASFTKTVDMILTTDFKRLGENGYQFYLNNYTVDHTYQTIMKHFQ